MTRSPPDLPKSGKAERIEAQLAQHVAGLGQARHALAVNLEQVQATIPDDGALIEYLRYRCYLGKNQWEQRYGAIAQSRFVAAKKGMSKIGASRV